METRWEILKKKIQSDTYQLKIQGEEGPLSFAKVFQAWEENADFRSLYARILQELEFKSFYWEHPALISDYLSRPYECQVIHSPFLDNLALNDQAFSKYIFSESLISNFDNLGKDAHLLVPNCHSKPDHYRHLASFIRFAPEAQVQALFQKLGQVLKQKIQTPHFTWLNTAGMGVIWLHVRLDSRPKYYKSQAYKSKEYLA